MNKLPTVVFKAYTASCQKIAGKVLITLVAMCLGFTATSPLALSQKDSNTSERKVITRVEPKYPPTLERLYIGGIVRLKVVVAPGGSVESTELMGGNPILGQSAIAAVKQWKYAPASTETTNVVRLEFDPHH